MNRLLRVAVAEDEPELRDYFRERLTALGHEIVCLAESGDELVEQCRAQRPDVLITDIKMTGVDGIDAAAEVYREGPLPIILVSGYHDEELIERAEQSHVLAYLVKPIKGHDLKAAIPLAMRRFEELQTLSKETADLRQALSDRKIVERAKGILMKRGGIDEQEAFRRMQKLASDKNKKLVEIADIILTAEQAVQIRSGG